MNGLLKMNSKQISLEWKSVDLDFLEKAFGNSYVNWNRILKIPSSMGIDFSVEGINISHPSSCLVVQYRDKEWKAGKYTEAEPYFLIWDGKNWDKKSLDFVVENVKIRPKLREAKNYNKWIDNISINDFVKFNGQRNTRIWKKIIGITENTVNCLQYTKPIDDMRYFQGYSSETLIWKIKEKYENQ